MNSRSLGVLFLWLWVPWVVLAITIARWNLLRRWDIQMYRSCLHILTFGMPIHGMTLSQLSETIPNSFNRPNMTSKSLGYYQSRHVSLYFYGFSRSTVVNVRLNIYFCLYNNMCTYNTRSSNTDHSKYMYKKGIQKKVYWLFLNILSSYSILEKQ